MHALTAEKKARNSCGNMQIEKMNEDSFGLKEIRTGNPLHAKIVAIRFRNDLLYYIYHIIIFFVKFFLLLIY